MLHSPEDIHKHTDSTHRRMRRYNASSFRSTPAEYAIGIPQHIKHPVPCRPDGTFCQLRADTPHPKQI